nr:immunoglobulin heavy chain junction region [Macaca mulatta]MOX15130.1 immunoglobulin heavy chain junction region [Macaca mulatta]MOX15328.1 immunoglobulin heavy chain junction region [Macaca mulatta]MOX15754.1 immunoglobulin heavy chain junction region [Macaca mulatta]MOX15902.1 immunoglobulin heavy chain junction region [Macaca mulatta]
CTRYCSTRYCSTDVYDLW